MKDQLVDIVNHTHKLGIFDTIKVIGTDKSTILETEADDKSVIMRAEFKDPMADFIGTFGMPGIGQLATLLNLDEYREDATITDSSVGSLYRIGIHPPSLS